MKNTWIQLFAQGAEGTGEGDAPTRGEEASGLLEQQAEEAVPAETPEDRQNPLVLEHWQRVDRIYNDWMAQGEQLKQFFPDFDIRKELSDHRFAGMLLAGVDISSAYQAIHAGQILPAAMEYAAKAVEAKLSAALRSGSYRPGENGLGGGAAALVGRNVTQMTRQDYDKYCRMVERGERISFG